MASATSVPTRTSVAARPLCFILSAIAAQSPRISAFAESQENVGV